MWLSGDAGGMESIDPVGLGESWSAGVIFSSQVHAKEHGRLHATGGMEAPASRKKETWAKKSQRSCRL